MTRTASLLVMGSLMLACSGAEPPSPPHTRAAAPAKQTAEKATSRQGALSPNGERVGVRGERSDSPVRPVPPSPARSTPAPPPGPLPEAGRPLGTAHPYLLVAASAERRWAVICQARADTTGDGAIDVRTGIHGETRGDEMVPYLVSGHGEGEAIDDYVASDPTGRFLAIVQEGELVLVDSASSRRDELSSHGADATNDGSPFGGFRGGSFDGAGRLFSYVRNREGGRAVVIRDLRTHEETEIDPGPGLLHRSFIDRGGRFVVIDMVARDTDGNGRIEPPTPRTSLAGGRCRGPIRSYSTSGMSGDTPETRVGIVGEEHVRPIAGLVRTFGDRLIVRTADGGLGLRTWESEQTQPWVPGSCQPDLVAVYPQSDRLVVTCGSLSAPQRGMATAGRFEPLAVGQRAGAIGPLQMEARLYPAYSERRLDVADLATGQVHRRSAHYVANHASRLLVGEGADLVSWEPATGHTVRVRVGRNPPADGFAQSGPVVAIWQVVFDLAQNRVLGRFEGAPLAVSADGHVLVATSPPPRDGMQIPSGPLLWRASSPP